MTLAEMNGIYADLQHIDAVKEYNTKLVNYILQMADTMPILRLTTSKSIYNKLQTIKPTHLKIISRNNQTYIINNVLVNGGRVI